ncbi:The fantastic four family [Parasponia andersonii]|uniref:The fantastic four family n=1 Tax=Parasponia andersonii TaxID=3476 RepID=A0A2P5B5I1_PARAD|nr:The fantastic four family [Parasponia andersonii]
MMSNTGDFIDSETGVFITSGGNATNDDTITKNKHVENTTKAAPRHRRNYSAKGTEFPPPLTTSLVRTTGHLPMLAKRFHLVRRSMDDGKRLVVQAVEINDDKRYRYLRVNRANERLIMDFVPINKLELETNSDNDDGGDDDSSTDTTSLDEDDDGASVEKIVAKVFG